MAFNVDEFKNEIYALDDANIGLDVMTRDGMVARLYFRQILLRIDSDSVFSDLEVKMRAGDSARLTAFCDLLTLVHTVALRDGIGIQMGVIGKITVIVPDLYPDPYQTNSCFIRLQFSLERR